MLENPEEQSEISICFCVEGFRNRKPRSGGNIRNCSNLKKNLSRLKNSNKELEGMKKY